MSGARTAYLVAGVRTPIGRYGGALAAVRPDDLAAEAVRALLQRLPAVPWDEIDDIVLGCANQAGEDNRNVARMAGLLAGLPVSVPGSTVNRLCGSGADAVAIAARAVISGQADLVIAGGVESMSRAPFVLGKAESAFSRQAQIQDTTIGWRFINPALDQRYGSDSMPQTADTVAREFGISRGDQDAFALRSQLRAARAQESGWAARLIVPVPVPRSRAEVELVDRDEHPRATTAERLAALRPINPSGTVTAGNASGVNDGAAAVLIASQAAVERWGLSPWARVTGAAVAGVEPRIMGIGPEPATRRLLARTGLTLADLDLIELNEAFAAQALAVLRSWGLPDDAAHVNPHGGAIAWGHPLGMSGARLALFAALGIADGQARRALVTMCIGVGQGISLLLESC